MSKKTDKKKPAKKEYQPPQLIEYGSVRQFTRTGTYGSMTDGGTGTMTMRNCVGAVSYLEEHQTLLSDTSMQRLFRDAIHSVVRPGSIVLDLGTGSGIHAMFACQAGAARVYAIDAEPVIELARAAAEENGFGDRIHFILGESQSITLPEKVDVIITNIGFLGTLAAVPDAAARFLKPGGRLVPADIELSFVPVAATNLHDSTVEVWTGDFYGLSFSSVRRYAANKPSVSHFQTSDFLAEPAHGQVIDLSRPLPDRLSWNMHFVSSRSGLCTGIAGWYSFRLCTGTTLSLEPPLSVSPDIWRHIYLPLESPIALREGDCLEMTVELFPTSNPDEPFWRWEIRHDGTSTAQSSFDAVPLSRELLSKLRSAPLPLGQDG